VVDLARWGHKGYEREPEVLFADASVRDAEQSRQTGRLSDARTRFAVALEASREAEDDELFARSALGLGGVWVHEHRSAVERAHIAAVQRQALAMLDDESPLAVRLQARIAAEESYLSGDPSAVFEAVRMARKIDDSVALAEALSLAHHCLLGPDYAHERIALAEELIEVSAVSGRSLDATMGLLWRTVDLFLTGDPRADRSLEELKARDLEDCAQFTVLAIGVMQAIRAGELDRAETLARECFDFGMAVGDADALGWYGAHLVLLRWLQGRGGELLPFLLEVRESPSLAEPNDAFNSAIAAVAAAEGEVDVARAALQRMRARGFGATRNSSTWLVTLGGIAEAAYHLGDGGLAREVYDLLAPHAALPIMASIAVGCFGSSHRLLGVAAATFHDLDLAVAHLELAVDADIALANRPCLAMSCAALADALQQRGRADDRDRVTALRRRAIETAETAGMPRRAEEWAARLDTFGAIECRREGRAWRWCYDGRTVLVPDSVGMGYLARLVASPGKEIAAVELAGQHENISSARQAIADDQAVAAYRRRVGELQAEIDEADDRGDIERATRARAEFDALVDEVRRTTGLLGRPRSFADDVERARTSVQKAIKRAVQRVADADAPLGRELLARVVTGNRCFFVARDD
jgi:hypothetical protein